MFRKRSRLDQHRPDTACYCCAAAFGHKHLLLAAVRRVPQFIKAYACNSAELDRFAAAVPYEPVRVRKRPVAAVRSDRSVFVINKTP